MTGSATRKSIKEMLFNRYKRFVLTKLEVEREILDKANHITSTSSEANTWLIDDVAIYLTEQTELKIHKCNKEHRAESIVHTNKKLSHYWDVVMK